MGAARGEAVYRLAPEPALAAIWEQRARARLDAALCAALGSRPEDLEIEPLVVRAPAAFALDTLADQGGDLLVLGAGPRHRLARMLRGRVRRQTVARAHAPILLISPPASPRRVRRELRRITPEDFLRSPRPGRGR